MSLTSSRLCSRFISNTSATFAMRVTGASLTYSAFQPNVCILAVGTTCGSMLESLSQLTTPVGVLHSQVWGVVVPRPCIAMILEDIFSVNQTARCNEPTRPTSYLQYPLGDIPEVSDPRGVS